jgi:putative transcriptional regulator
MAPNNLKPKKGRLLISKPYLHDPYFKRSVVLLTEHNKEGSVGFILNKQVDLNIGEAIEEFPEFESKLFLGGPVEKDSLYYIHTMGDTISDSVQIAKGIYWGGNFEVLKVLIENKKIQQSELKFFMGYSGWSSDQLAHELKNDSWIVADINKTDIINDLPENLWANLLRGMGKDYAVLANFPEHPSLN